jgi:ABC-2 type transport system permease protein
MAKHEYLRTARKRAFLLSALGMPLLIIVVVGISIIFTLAGDDDTPLGYVDQAGILSAGVAWQEEGEESVPLIAYPDTEAAAAALDAGEIQAYYVLPPSYPAPTAPVRLFYAEEEPGSGARNDFTRFLRANLAQGLAPDVRQRALDGVEVAVRSADGSREISEAGIANIALPFVAAFFFFFATIGTAGYLLQVVADEKENRTVEILITSMSPEALIAGKAVGLMAVALSIILLWTVALVIGLTIGARFVEALRNIGIPWGFLAIIAVYFVPAYALIAGLMTAVGGAVTEVQQGQQITGVLNLLFILPLFAISLILVNPDSPILVALTLFPTTSFLTVTLRWGLNIVPLWQLLASWFLLVATAIFSLWASARIFRAGMLRYGQRLSWQGMLAAIRPGKNQA